MMVTTPQGPLVAAPSVPDSLYRDIFANAVEAIAVIDLEGRYVEQNSAHRHLLGYSDSDLQGQTPAIHMGEETFLEVARALSETGRYQGEVDTRSKQGERLRIDLCAFTVRDDAGRPVCYVGIKRDITERDRARHALREHEENLAKNREHIEQLYERLQRAMVETHHRVKNNLQIIAAMIDLRVMDDVPQVPIAELVRLGTHVRTLAMVHELLTEQAKEDGEGQVVSAQEVLEHLLPLLQQTNIHRRLEFDLQEVFVSSRQATALSLVVNELVSNAQKHGSRGVHVSLSARDHRAILTVADDGPGFPPDFDADRAGNTGLELVNRLSRWDLHGDIRYANLPGGGAEVTVSFPLPAAYPLASSA